MALAGPNTRSSRRRSLDAEINLVPFIDLLSMCICFLLMTAVWIQIGVVEVKQLVGTETTVTTDTLYDMDLKYTSAQSLDVIIKKSGRPVQKFVARGATPDDRLKQLKSIVLNLESILKLNVGSDLKSKIQKMFSAARVTTRSDISYGELVSVLDVIRDNGVTNVGVVPAR